MRALLTGAAALLLGGAVAAQEPTGDAAPALSLTPPREAGPFLSDGGGARAPAPGATLAPPPPETPPAPGGLRRLGAGRIDVPRNFTGDGRATRGPALSGEIAIPR